MATINVRKDKDGKDVFQAIIRMKGYPTQCATFKSKTKAKLWVQQTETAIRDGRYFKTAEARKHTLSDLIDRYIDNVLPHKYAKETDREKVKTHLNWWKSKLGYSLLIDLTPAILAEHRDKLLKEPYKKFKRTSNKTNEKKTEDKKSKENEDVERLRSGATVNRYMASLSTALTIATNEWMWLEENPMLKVRKYQENRGRVRFLSDDEHNALLEACKNCSNPSLYVVVQIALSTGARFSEIMNLKWKDVDFDRRMLSFLDTKNKEHRSVPLTGEAYDLLEAHSKIRKINTKYVFPGKDGHKPIELKRQWENAIETSGLTDFRFHDLRHTAASYLAKEGASLLEIAHVLGHKTLQMTKRYSHLTDQHGADMLERMNKKRSKIPSQSTGEDEKVIV
jgi:integrase